jgi:linoleoyl-CoA desaturase
VSSIARTRPQFPPHSALRAELTERVDAYFEQTGLSRDGGSAALFKTIAVFAWATVSYLLLLFWAESWWTALPLTVSLALALAGVGFSVMHDGSHGAYSKSPLVNRLAAATLDFLGASSYVWRQKHVVLHHTYTNVAGADDDINAEPFLRLAPTQRLRWYHRYQRLYFPLLIGLFFTTKWAVWDDFAVIAKGMIGGQRIPRPSGWGIVQILAGKLMFVGWAVALPLMFHPVLPVLVCYTLLAFVWGITLGLVFQLAHAVDEAEFPTVTAENPTVERPWFEHQLATTANFAMRNPVITWYVGGLNYQVEHHLLPRIGHRHYPALAPIVRDVARKHGAPYHAHETMRGAVASHLRFLGRMGETPAPVAAQPKAASAPDLLAA